MKSLFFLIITVLLLIACNKEKSFKETSKALNTTIQNEKGEISTGETYIKITSNKEVMILQSTNPEKQDEVDKVIVLAFEKEIPAHIKEGKLEYADIIHFKDKRSLLIHSKKDNKVMLFGLDEEDSNKKLQLIQKITLLSYH